MNILFLTDNFPPEVNAAATRVYERACYWVKWGHNVTIITCAPNFPQGKLFSGYKNSWYQVEYIDGIRVVRVKTFMAKNAGFLLRILDFMSYMFMASIIGLFEGKKPDVIVATSPQFFTAIAGYWVSFWRRKPFIFELSDLWPAFIAAVGSISKTSKIYRLIEKVELFLYKKAKKIIALSHAFKQDLIYRGINKDKIDVILNGVDLTRYSPKPKDKSLLDKFNIKDELIIGYIGTHGMAHNLSNVIYTAEKLQNLPIKFLFVGDGADKNKIIKLSKKLNLNNIIFEGIQPKSKISNYWSICDLALVHLKDDPVFSTVVPSKIFEAMGMGLPILYIAPKGETSDFIEKEQIGFIVKPNNPELLANKLKDILKEKSELYKIRDKSLIVAKSNSRENQSKKLINSIEISEDCVTNYPRSL